jgi:hypothetical protein
LLSKSVFADQLGNADIILWPTISPPRRVIRDEWRLRCRLGQDSSLYINARTFDRSTPQLANPDTVPVAAAALLRQAKGEKAGEVTPDYAAFWLLEPGTRRLTERDPLASGAFKQVSRALDCRPEPEDREGGLCYSRILGEITRKGRWRRVYDRDLG